MQTYCNTKTGQKYKPTFDTKPYTTLSGDKIELRRWLSNCAHCGAEFSLWVSERSAGASDTMFKRRNCDAHKGRITPEGKKAISEARRLFLQSPEGKAAEQKRCEALAVYRTTPEGRSNTRIWAKACAEGRRKAAQARKDNGIGVGVNYDPDGYPAPYSASGYEAAEDESADAAFDYVNKLIELEGREFPMRERERARLAAEATHARHPEGFGPDFVANTMAAWDRDQAAWLRSLAVKHGW